MEGGPDEFASVSKHVLDINSLAHVFDACKDCAVNWNPVGLYLGLSPLLLREIAAKTTEPRERLRKVLEAWLQKNTIPGSPDPSYHTLCHSVATGGENPALADRIAAARSATADDNDQQQMDTDTESISSASYYTDGYYTDEELNRLCSCGECSLQKIITEGCPATGAMSSHRFPLLDIKRLPDGKRQQYIFMIEKETKAINKAFANLYLDISQSMRDVNVVELKTYCKNNRWFSDAVDPCSLHYRLEHCEDTESVFSVLADICSWFNHHPLEPLVDQFGSKDVKAKYAMFVNNTLTAFLKRSITEIPKDGLGEIIEGSGQFRLKIDTLAAHENIRGEHVIFLKGSVAEALGISLEHLHILCIKGGCIEVTFMIPQVIYKELFLPGGLSSQYSQALQSVTVPIDEHHSLIVKSVHWYDSELQCSQEKVFCVNTNPQEFLSTERSSDTNQVILSDVHASKEVLNQDIENGPSNSDSLQALPNGLTEAPAFAPHVTFDEIQGNIAGVLLEVVDEVNYDVEGVKKYLLAFSTGIKNEVELVRRKKDLIAFLQKYCNFSNFGLLNCIAKQFKLDNSKKKLKEVAKKRHQFYKKTLAIDFARQSIEDHVMLDGQREMTITVSWKKNATMYDFDEFIKDAFHTHRMFVSLKAVRMGPLSFVCTIPSWLVDEMKQFVRGSQSYLKSRGIIEVSVDNNEISIGFVPFDLHENVESEQAAKKALASLLKRFQAQQEELRILVTGKTGQGKSTLVNGILGAKVAREGARAKRVTTEVEVFSETINDVPIKVFDSPGLQDRTANEEEYIRGMRDTCKELSLVLYCTKIGNTRLGDDDKYAMMKLTRAFGEEFWNYAVFVLTFANLENVSRSDDRDDDDEPEPDLADEEGWKRLEKKRFQGRLKLWEEELQSFLIGEVGVSPNIARGIPVVPTGDHKKSRLYPQPFVLPDREDWFNEFWKVCCLRVKDTYLFLQVNYHSNRLEVPDEGDDISEDFEDDKEHSVLQVVEALDRVIAATNNEQKRLISSLPRGTSQESSQSKIRRYSSASLYSQDNYERPQRHTQSFSVPPSPGHLYKRRIVIDEEFSQCIVAETIERNAGNNPEVIDKVKTALKGLTNKAVSLMKTFFRMK